jgi:hypothetical protein
LVTGAIVSAVGVGAFPGCWSDEPECTAARHGLFFGGLGLGGIGGGVLMGLGLRTWRESTAAPEGVATRRASPRVLGGGIALTVVGAAAFFAGFALSMITSCTTSDPGFCSSAFPDVAAVLLASGSPLLAGGVPMIVLGRHEVQDYGVEVSASGSGLSVRGRF